MMWRQATKRCGPRHLAGHGSTIGGDVGGVGCRCGRHGHHDHHDHRDHTVDGEPRAEMMMSGIPFLPTPSSSFENSRKDNIGKEEEGLMSLSGTVAPRASS
jgi:hypothetical protein